MYKRVYLVIDEGRFCIALLQKRGDFFVSDSRVEESLCSHVIHNGVIYNPSQLVLLIAQFLQKHRLQGARAIVCCPYLALFKPAKKKLATLQIALSVSKAGLSIERLCEEEFF